MRIADLSPGMSKLHEARDELLLAWSDVCESWQDANARNFEENHLQPLTHELAGAFIVIQKLADALAAAARECGPQE